MVIGLKILLVDDDIDIIEAMLDERCELYRYGL